MEQRPERTLHDDSDDSSEESYTVEEAIEHLGFGKFQAAMVVYTGMTWLADAMEMILLSYVGPAARCEWGLTGQQEGYITSVVFLGVFLGTYIWGIVSDTKGRRRGYFTTAVFTLLFGLLSAWAPYFWMLLVFRLLVGVGLGGAPVILSLCSEFLPSSSRGFWLVFIEFFWTIGTVAEALLAWIMMPHLQWRWLVLMSALPFVIMLIFYPILPESPRFLLVQGDLEGAKAVLKRIADVNGKMLPRGKLVFSSQARLIQSCDEESSSEYHSKLPDRYERKTRGKSHTVIKDEALSFHSHGTSNFVHKTNPLQKLSKLLSRKLLRTTFILWLVFFASAFTYYGQVLLTTQLSVSGDPTCSALHSESKNKTRDVIDRGLMAKQTESGTFQRGSNVPSGILRLSHRNHPLRENTELKTQHLQKFELENEERLSVSDRVLEKGISGVEGHIDVFSHNRQLRDTLDDECTIDKRPIISDSTYIDVLITSCAELPGLIVALLIVDTLGRKKALSLLMLCSGLFLVPLWAVLSESLTTALLFGARACIMGSFAILWAYSPELYPTDVRVTGVGVGNAWGRLGGFTCPFVAVGLVSSCHRGLAIALFAGIPLLAAIAAIFFPKETEGHAMVDGKPSTLNIEIYDEEAVVPLTGSDS